MLTEWHWDSEKEGYRQRAVSPWGLRDTAQMDVQHAARVLYLHYEMSDIKHFGLSVRWIWAGVLSAGVRRWFLRFQRHAAGTCSTKANKSRQIITGNPTETLQVS